MRGENVGGSTGIVPAPNGAPRPAKRKGSAGKKQTDASPANNAEPFVEAPAATEIAPVDAPMWPLHSVVWLQTDLGPSAPAWSGLVIAHHNRIPAPDFVSPGVDPLNRQEARAAECHALLRVPTPKVPQSDLAPLGWDPRTVGRKGGSE